MMDTKEQLKSIMTNSEKLQDFLTRKDVTILLVICLMYFVWTFSYKLGKDLAFRDMGKQPIENK
ncbi:hypothetical protein [Mucilaginibacter sp. SP1R1]|uniref:hypothetical protein n=1 Tax=Mucilaginibacter sp. SP1R1 TaxID=2723091 RepID=UPI00161E8EDA|nr:Fe2+ transport system protein B [Mucilaginibacter sp. SP1R1]